MWPLSGSAVCPPADRGVELAAFVSVSGGKRAAANITTRASSDPVRFASPFVCGSRSGWRESLHDDVESPSAVPLALRPIAFKKSRLIHGTLVPPWSLSIPPGETECAWTPLQAGCLTRFLNRRVQVKAFYAPFNSARMNSATSVADGGS